MSKDIEARLRAHVVDCYGGKNDTMREAADYIAKLRAEVKNAFADGLERAAKVADQGHCTSSGCDVRRDSEWHSDLCPVGIATRIRALKTAESR